MMPLIGWSAGLTVSGFIETFDHWVAFGLLLAYGFISGTEVVFGLEINARTLLTPIILALLAAVIASTIPARRAAKLSPIEVIRNG